MSVLQSGRLWARWSWAASCSCCFWGSAGASVALTPAVATCRAAAVLTPAAARDTVSGGRNFILLIFSFCCSLSVEIYPPTPALLSCAVYEAGKMAKRRPPAPLPVYPYYVPGVPAVVPVSVAPSSHVEPKITSLPSVETNLGGGESE